MKAFLTTEALFLYSYGQKASASKFKSLQNSIAGLNKVMTDGFANIHTDIDNLRFEFKTEIEGIKSTIKDIELTNRRQFSMVYTLIDHKMTSKMFKTQVEPRAAGEWFHCQGLDILWRHFMVYKSIEHRKLPSICFLQ